MSPTGGSWLARLAGLRPVRPVLLLATALLGACTLGPRSGELHPPSSSPAAGAEEPAPRLDATVGAVVESEVGAGERHVFPIELEEGTYFEVHVDRPGDELDIHLFDPGVDPQADPGAAYVSGERATGHDGQMLWEVTRAAGEHHLRVDGQEEPAAYRLEVVALRPATERDWSRHRGMRMYEQGQALKRDHRLEDALEKFLEARELFARGEYERGIGATYTYEAQIQTLLGRRDTARDAYRKAAVHWRLGDSTPAVISSLTSLASLERDDGRWEQAEATLEEAAALAQGDGDPELEAEVLDYYCRLYMDQGLLEAALDKCDRALQIRETLHHPERSVGTLIILGQIRIDRGEMETARELLTRGVERAKRYGRVRQEATALNELARLDEMSGHYLQALGSYQDALRIYEELGEIQESAQLLGNIGTIHERLGDLDQTLQYYRRALARTNVANDLVGRFVILRGMAWTLRELGDLEEARKLLDEMEEISREIASPRHLAAALESSGELQLDRGEAREALRSFEDALELYRGADLRWQEAAVLPKLAEAHAAQGHLERAVEILREAAALNGDLGRRAAMAECYYETALVHRRSGDLQAAQEAIERALGTAEQVRLDSGNQEIRALYTATVRPYYELQIDLLMTQHELSPEAGFDVEALLASERSRAQSLREILAEADIDLAVGVPLELVARRRELQRQIDEKHLGRETLRQQGGPRGSLFDAELDLQRTLTALQETERQIRETNPRYSALVDPEPITLHEIGSLLDRETALLEYSLGEPRSFLWVVRDDALHSYVLPGREEIEQQARCVHELITAYGAPPSPEGLPDTVGHCLGPQLETYRSIADEGLPIRARGLRRREIEVAFDRTAAELAQTVLGGPVRDGVLPIRLALVSDGALEYVPFTALPRPSTDAGPARSRRDLLDEHEIVRIPSASVLAVQRRHADSPSTAPTGLVAVIADPVYGRDDPRWLARPTHASPNDAGSAAGGAAGTVAPVSTLRRLDLSGDEARAIASLAPPEKTLRIEGFGANTDRVTSEDLGGFRYVHFATHGEIDTEYPQLSSLVLSQLDENGRWRDGHLRLHDIYGLDLDGVDMVVLSACETALGREVRGEGLMGLTRGFLYAGADRVAATLWQVQDVMTAELMTRFYAALFEHDCAPADALRRAQIAVRDADGGAHSFPYYWAGFVLQGEWR